jgi:hypothetical protein
MNNDPLLRKPASTAQESYASSQNPAHTNPHMWHDPDAGKPKILSTPIYDHHGHLESFPDYSDLFKLSSLPGFDPIGSEHIFKLPGFDIHETSWQDLILFNEDDKQPWQDLIIRGEDGRIDKIIGTQKHHVIHQALKDRKLFKLADMDMEDSINKMLLPTKDGADKWNTTRSIHQGRHLGSVTKDLEAKMINIEEIGKAQGWSTLDYQRELKKIIQEERSILRSGHRALNKNQREWANK